MLTQKIKPSKFCPIHTYKPAWSRGLCKNCYNKWTKLYKDKKKAYDKQWRSKKDKNYNTIRNLKIYGMTISQLQSQFPKYSRSAIYRASKEVEHNA